MCGASLRQLSSAESKSDKLPCFHLMPNTELFIDFVIVKSVIYIGGTRTATVHILAVGYPPSRLSLCHTVQCFHLVFCYSIQNSDM